MKKSIMIHIVFLIVGLLSVIFMILIVESHNKTKKFIEYSCQLCSQIG